MSFKRVSMTISDDTNNIIQFKKNVSSPYKASLNRYEDGTTFRYLIKKAGYTANYGYFSSGGLIPLSLSLSEKRNIKGESSYTDTESEDISISFSFEPEITCFINIGNAVVSSQTIFDMTEKALTTQEGCRFLNMTNASECLFLKTNEENYLILGKNYRLKRRSHEDVNAGIDACPVSADGITSDLTNGAIKFSGTQIWDSLLSENQKEGSIGKAIQDILTAARMSVAVSL